LRGVNIAARREAVVTGSVGTTSSVAVEGPVATEPGWAGRSQRHAAAGAPQRVQNRSEGGLADKAVSEVERSVIEVGATSARAEMARVPTGSFTLIFGCERPRPE
jgi:hypothetical protein